MKYMSLLSVVLVLAGCASAPIVQTDHDSAVDFSNYRSYPWRQQPPVSNPLVKQRLIAAIEAELASKGWTPMPEGSADIALVGNVATHKEQTIDTFYGGANWSTWQWQRDMGVGSGYRTVQVHTYQVGTFVLDMFDTKTKQAVWRGTAEGTVPESPKKVNAAIQTAITRMFSAFPPASPSGR